MTCVVHRNLPLVEELNKLAKDGWEAVCLIEKGRNWSDQDFLTFLLKKKVTENE